MQIVLNVHFTTVVFAVQEEDLRSGECSSTSLLGVKFISTTIELSSQQANDGYPFITGKETHPFLLVEIQNNFWKPFDGLSLLLWLMLGLDCKYVLQRWLSCGVIAVVCPRVLRSPTRLNVTIPQAWNRSQTREQQLLDMDSLPHQSFYNSLTGNLTHAISRSSNKLYSVSGKDGYLENEL
uniref:Uncharacterized protein n=1 Tax=Cucumis sativus TaxID=3659 RepID=A0A0A0L6Y5_CUCSA